MRQAQSDPRWKGLLVIQPRVAMERTRWIDRRGAWAVCVSMVIHATTALALVVASQRASIRPIRAAFAGQARHIQISVQASMSLVASASVQVAASPDDIIVRPDEVQIAQQHYRLAATQPTESDETNDVVATAETKPPEIAPPQRRPISQPEPQIAEVVAQLERRVPSTMPVPASAASAGAVARDQNLSQGTDSRIQPRFISNRPPRYPEQARQRRWQGTVYLRLTLDEEGQVVRVVVERSSGYPVLDAEAANAVRQWRAEPAQVNGRPVASEELLPVRFELPR